MPHTYLITWFSAFTIRTHFLATYERVKIFQNEMKKHFMWFSFTHFSIRCGKKKYFFLLCGILKFWRAYVTLTYSPQHSLVPLSGTKLTLKESATAHCMFSYLLFNENRSSFYSRFCEHVCGLNLNTLTSKEFIKSKLWRKHKFFSISSFTEKIVCTAQIREFD